MTTKILLCLVVLLAGTALCSAGPCRAVRPFPEVGKSYSVEIASAGAVGNAIAQDGESLRSRDTVKIIAKGEHEWCLVECFRFVRVDEKTKKPEFSITKFWLNFGTLTLAREMPADWGHGIIVLR